MKICIAKSFKEREGGDLLVVPYWEGGELASSLGSSPDASFFLKMGDFKGKSEETALLYQDGKREPRILLLGFGKKELLTVEILRRAVAAMIQVARSKKAKQIHFLFPKIESFSTEETLRGLCEGLLLTNYSFTKHKSDASKETFLTPVETVLFFGVDKEMQKQIDVWQKLARGVYHVRDLVNENADEVIPERLAKDALAMHGKKVRVAIFDKTRLEKEGMGLILAVGRGSKCDPCLIQATYKGNPRSKEHIVLVGKGVTYDTGGLCLKPAEGMLTMKRDMAGAATVLETVKMAAECGLKVNVTALAPAAENSIGPKSYKTGDVYRSYSGKTVEVVNTDAEGRLILADALAYAVKELHPTMIIDIATLTGSVVVALGEEIGGLFANRDEVAQGLLLAAQRTGENLWRMPLYPYKEALCSEIADLANTGSGREAGSIKAALFLQEFIGEIPWAHIDMAGPASFSKPKYYYPTRGTGWGLRLLFDFLANRSKTTAHP